MIDSLQTKLTYSNLFFFFRKFKRSSKQSSATEALVSSLVLVEGQSTTTVDAVLPDEITESQKASDASAETAKMDDQEQNRDYGQVRTINIL